jgi:hypothetical protein
MWDKKPDTVFSLYIKENITTCPDISVRNIMYYYSLDPKIIYISRFIKILKRCNIPSYSMNNLYNMANNIWKIQNNQSK